MVEVDTLQGHRGADRLRCMRKADLSECRSTEKDEPNSNATCWHRSPSCSQKKLVNSAG